jgi:hypothetical protein
MTPYDWPPSPHWAIYAMRVRLLALVKKGEAKQGWVPCRQIRKAAGL